MTNIDQTPSYAVEPSLEPAEFIAVLESSGLASRRPTSDPARIARMIGNASIIVTARVQGQLIGVSRAISDHAFCIYVSDLAVDRASQGRGIGRELLRRSHEEAGSSITDLILLSAPEAEAFYPHIGLRHSPNCFLIQRTI